MARARSGADAEHGGSALAGGGQGVDVGAVAQEASREERVGDGDADLAGEVVVAGPGVPEGNGAVRRSEGADLLGWGDPCRRAERVGDRARGEVVAALAPVPLAGDQLPFEEPGEMGARRARRNPRPPRELAGQEELAGHQRIEDRRTRGLGDECCDGRDVYFTVLTIAL